ncbi:MAG TPA: circadian clock protein KaiC [Candidatus Dormibacteraeota bacterium]
MSASPNGAPAKLPTFLEGFDVIADGGLPAGRVTLVSGTAGTGKTIFAVQFLVEGIRKSNEGAVFVTFEESAQDIRQNMLSFGWDIQRWEDEGLWAFVDAAFAPDTAGTIAGSYDLSALTARIEHAMAKVNAKRVALDSFSAVQGQFPDLGTMRAELFRITNTLKALGVTAVVTSERTHDYGELTRSGIEEFVADNVVILRNVLDDEKRRRTVEILKFRGAYHQRGEYPLAIIPDTGLVVVPLSANELRQRSTEIRITSGVEELDRMCGGGFFRDSVTLVSGATGTGKTLLVTEFVKGGFEHGEKVLVFAFEESREQLTRNARGWGVDFQKMEEAGQLRLRCQYPEMTGPEEHLVQMKALVQEFKPDRVAIDSLSAVERVTTPKSFREFVLGVTTFLRDHDIAGLFTATTPQLLGGSSITATHVSTVTDTIVLLRYLERQGEVQRGITVLKMRGSMHDKSIREFKIDGSGMHIGEPLVGITGVLSGSPIYRASDPGA